MLYSHIQVLNCLSVIIQSSNNEFYNEFIDLSIVVFLVLSSFVEACYALMEI